LVTRFADAEKVYSDPRFSAEKVNATAEVRAVPWVGVSDLIGLGRTIVFLDPPAHTRLRRLVAKAFTPRRVETLRPMVQDISGGLLDPIVPRGRADILHEYSTPLAALTIMTLLGSPVADREEFHRLRAPVPVDRSGRPGPPTRGDGVDGGLLRRSGRGQGGGTRRRPAQRTDRGP
jgi:cytochrome P450